MGLGHLGGPKASGDLKVAMRSLMHRYCFRALISGAVFFCFSLTKYKYFIRLDGFPSVNVFAIVDAMCCGGDFLTFCFCRWSNGIFQFLSFYDFTIWQLYFFSWFLMNPVLIYFQLIHDLTNHDANFLNIYQDIIWSRHTNTYIKTNLLYH